MFYLQSGDTNRGNFILRGVKHENTVGFNLVNNGVPEVNENEAINIRMIFDYYLARASLRKVVDMLYKKQIPSPTGKMKWTCAAVVHLLSNSKYIVIVGFESYASAQYEKANRCNIDKVQAAKEKLVIFCQN